MHEIVSDLTLIHLSLEFMKPGALRGARRFSAYGSARFGRVVTVAGGGRGGSFTLRGQPVPVKTTNLSSCIVREGIPAV